MSALPRYTLAYHERSGEWVLIHDLSGRAVKRFSHKEMATRGGILKRLVGERGGSIKIQKLNGKYQEERTFPPERDPHRFPG